MCNRRRIDQATANDWMYPGISLLLTRPAQKGMTSLPLCMDDPLSLIIVDTQDWIPNFLLRRHLWMADQSSSAEKLGHYVVGYGYAFLLDGKTSNTAKTGKARPFAFSGILLISPVRREESGAHGLYWLWCQCYFFFWGLCASLFLLSALSKWDDSAVLHKTYTTLGIL
jgi:hypothetical protein